VRIWFALLVAPMLALADQTISFAAVGWACAHQHHAVVHAVHALFFAAAAIGTAAAWQYWRTTLPLATGGEPPARRYFLAGLATASGALSVLVIAAMWMTAWVVPACID
jgi:hypothetical protein